MTGKENHDISLQAAAELTANYRNTPARLLGELIFPQIAEAFGKDAVMSLLSQNGITGMRIYYGLQLLPAPEFKLIIVGVNQQGNDVTAGVILNHGFSCPPTCPSANPLNS